jgi:hypothetical protein
VTLAARAARNKIGNAKDAMAAQWTRRRFSRTNAFASSAQSFASFALAEVF